MKYLQQAIGFVISVPGLYLCLVGEWHHVYLLRPAAWKIGDTGDEGRLGWPTEPFIG